MTKLEKDLYEALYGLTRYVDVSTINNSKRTTARWSELKGAAEMALLSYHAAETRGSKALAGEGHVDGSSSPSQSSASPATRSGR